MAARAEGVPALDAASLLASAAAKTGGLRDFGDPAFGERLAILVQMLEEGRIAPERRAVAHEQVSDLLAERLRFARDRREHPEIGREVVRAPLMVTGLARSGTTMFHALLAEDPANRAPRKWEVQHPSPPPGLAGPDDPRIALTAREEEEHLAWMPGLLQAHPYSDQGAYSLSECESWLALDLRNTFPNSFFKVASTLTRRPLSTDYPANYAWHRAFLQQLQFGAAPRRWVLKGTQHHYHFAEVRATYPDAIVLWIHRDPARVLPSMLELVSIIQEAITGRAVNRPRIAAQLVPTIRADLERAMASPLAEHERVFHMRYAELMHDPPAMIRGVYERYEMAYTPAFDERLRAWPARNPPDRYGKFRYSLADFAMTAADLDAAFVAYRERFGIPRE